MNNKLFLELLSRAKRGDTGARVELFAHIADGDAERELLLRMARQLLPASDRARDFVESSDLVQSTLLSAWLDLSEFQGTTAEEFRNWLRTILRRKLSRVVRKRRPRAASHRMDKTAPRRAAANPLAGLVREEARERVRAAVDSLPEDQRLVISLRLQGLKAPEIARQLGLTPEVVRKRTSRASERLRAILGE